MIERCPKNQCPFRRGRLWFRPRPQPIAPRRRSPRYVEDGQEARTLIRGRKMPLLDGHSRTLADNIRPPLKPRPLMNLNGPGAAIADQHPLGLDVDRLFGLDIPFDMPLNDDRPG